MKRVTQSLLLTAVLGAATVGGVMLGLAAVRSPQAVAAPHSRAALAAGEHAAGLPPLQFTAAASCAAGSSAYTIVNQVKVVQVQYSLRQTGSKHRLTVKPVHDSPVSGCLKSSGGTWLVVAETASGKTLATTSLSPGHPAIRCLRARHHNTDWFFMAPLG